MIKVMPGYESCGYYVSPDTIGWGHLFCGVQTYPGRIVVLGYLVGIPHKYQDHKTKGKKLSQIKAS